MSVPLRKFNGNIFSSEVAAETTAGVEPEM